jgi:phosphate transport system substrate-binding protein
LARGAPRARDSGAWPELARYLNSPAASGKRFFIVGFADSVGSWGANRGLAAQRAMQVGRELERAGVRVPRGSLLTMSYMAPVACSDNDVGLAKNRRAELWIAR